MTILDGHSALVKENPDTASDWSARADDLARWVMARLITRRDVWGGYNPLGDRDKIVNRGGQLVPLGATTTRPAKHLRGRVILTHAVIRAHFLARSERDVIGAHTTSSENTSKFGTVELDYHGEGGNDPQTNLRAVLGWYEEAVRRGHRPLLTDSNGKGGYHLDLLFASPVPTPNLFHYLRQFVSDHARRGLSKPPETFPKQPRLEPGRFGNWVRVPGRHHSRPHWSLVWDGNRWLAGHEAIDTVLSLTGDPPTLIPPCPPPPARPVQSRQFVPRGGGNLTRRIAGYMRRLPNLGEGQGRDDVAFNFAAWLVRDLALSDPIALGWLCAWDLGNRPPKGRDRLAVILRNAHEYGQHTIGCGIDTGLSPVRPDVEVVPTGSPGHFVLRCRVEVS